MDVIGSAMTCEGMSPGRWARREVTIARMILASAIGSLVMKRIVRPLSTSQRAKLVSFSMYDERMSSACRRSTFRPQ